MPRRLTVLGLLFAVLATIALCSACSSNEEPVAPEAETDTSVVDADLMLESPAFEDESEIPVRFARQGVDGGENISIPLKWSGAPADTESFAVLMLDTHPVARRWVHWMAVDIPPSTTELPEGASGTGMPSGTVELDNSWGDEGYGGPEPPEGTGGHFYLTTVYALDVPNLEIEQDADVREFLRAIEDHVLAEGRVEGSLGR